MKELYECPNCGAEVDTAGMLKYRLIDCWNCEKELEFLGDCLVCDNEQEDQLHESYQRTFDQQSAMDNARRLK